MSTLNHQRRHRPYISKRGQGGRQMMLSLQSIKRPIRPKQCGGLIALVKVRPTNK